MEYKYDDGGREAAGYKGSTGDCVVRAVAIATGKPYQEVYDALSEGCRGERKGTKRSARNGVRVQRKWFKDYMLSLGWQWTATMGIGTGCTTHLIDYELPKGRLIVSLSKHYTAVIDGVIHDTHDPQRGSPWLTVSPERCVYGYWQPGEAQ